MNQVYIAIGSNIDPIAYLRQSITLLREHTQLLATSSIYETAPQGRRHQANFLNMAVLLETDLTPEELRLQILKSIEEALGRDRQYNSRYASHTIDLDIALWNDEIITYTDKPRYIPHPDVTDFAHTAVPLAEISPNYVHPKTGQTLAQIAAVMDQSGVVKRDDLTV